MSEPNHGSLLRDLGYLLSTFSRRDRLLLGVYVVAQFGLALMDLIGIAAVLPILQIISGSPIDEGYIGALHAMFGAPERTTFVLLLTVLMVVAFSVKTVLGLVLQWWGTGLVGRLQLGTATSLVHSYLAGDYQSRRGQSFADLSRIVDNGVNDAHSKVLGGLLSIVTSGLSVVTILAFLIAVQPVPTLIAIAYFSITVFVMQRLLGQRNLSTGRLAVEAAWRRSHVLIDIVDGFREVRMHDAQEVFAERFDEANATTIQAARRANLYSTVPKYALELITIIGVSLLLILALISMDAASIMTTMGLFVAVAVRLMPVLSGLTSQLGVVRSGQVGLGIMVSQLRENRRAASLLENASLPTVAPPTGAAALPLHVDDVTFRYPNAADDVIKQVSFSLQPGSSLAIVGLSGSGKTTLVDIILGLNAPRSGQVRLGPTPIRALGAKWYDVIAYVPQDVYLIDDTIAANVAYGVAAEKIDLDRVRQAVEQARLSTVVAGLPDGLLTRIGSRGTKLSGGQRQRIGIARALYRNPQIIVLDEATSALDNTTEHEVADTIRSLHGSVTTIQIAHRLSTVRTVDRLLYLEEGSVTAEGTFEQVQAQSAQFARLVQLGRLDVETTLHGDEAAR